MFRKIIVKLVCFTLTLSMLAGLASCSKEPEYVYKTESFPKNDGQSAEVTMDISGLDSGFVTLLEEIIERYNADFPNTTIRLTEDPQADILTIDNTHWAADGLLDLDTYRDFWYAEGTMTPGALFLMSYMGGEGLYTIPFDMEQMLLYYRSDWFDQFNADKETAAEKVRVITWNRFMEIRSKLSDRGRLSISSEYCEPLFDAMMWSIVGTGAGSAGACFARNIEGETCFTAEKAPKAVETFGMVMDSALRDGDMSPTEAIDAFVEGEAGMLIAPGSAAARLYEEMEDGTWESAILPMGDIGQTVVPALSWRGWSVNAEAHEPEKAIHFLAYLTNADNNTHMAKTLGTLPIYKESTTMEPSLNETHRAPDLATFTLADFRFARMPGYMFSEDAGNEFGLFDQELQEYLDGTMSSEELLSTLDKRCKEAYQAWLAAGRAVPWIVEEE